MADRDGLDDRARRIGRNEAIFREVNERIEDLSGRFHAVATDTLQLVCECGSLDCVEQLAVPLGAYEGARADPSLFVVKPGHEIPDVEDVVDRTSGYFVVRKRAGGAAELARETDPRS
jgi:hypothetical protein